MQKSINLNIIRKLIKYSFKNVLVKAMFTLTVLEILLFVGTHPAGYMEWKGLEI